MTEGAWRNVCVRGIGLPFRAPVHTSERRRSSRRAESSTSLLAFVPNCAGEAARGRLCALPIAGLTLLLGVDRFMSEARSITNLIGNAVATLVVARWEGALDIERARQVLRGEEVRPVMTERNEPLPEPAYAESRLG